MTHRAFGLPRFPVAAGFHAANAASQTMSVRPSRVDSVLRTPDAMACRMEPREQFLRFAAPAMVIESEIRDTAKSYRRYKISQTGYCIINQVG